MDMDHVTWCVGSYQPHVPDGVTVRRLPSKDRGPRLVSAEQDANAVAARRFPDGSADDTEDAAMDAGPGGVTKKPRVRISVRRGGKLNSTTTSTIAPPPPAAPFDAAPAPPTKEEAWRPSAVDENGLVTTELPAAGTPPLTAAPREPTHHKERGETMELSSVSPLQRTRLSTLRWRHPERGEDPREDPRADPTTEPPRRLRYRETPATTTFR